jgi:GntR family transcriptional regulator
LPERQIQIDFQSDVPIYVQITSQIEKLVEMQALRPGDQLPTVRQLAAQLGVNFNTVARAYRLLDETGLISTQHGRGTYILDLPASRPNGTEMSLEHLIDLTRDYIRTVERAGYEPGMVEAVFQAQFQAWQRPLEEGTKD